MTARSVTSALGVRWDRSKLWFFVPLWFAVDEAYHFDQNRPARRHQRATALSTYN